MVQGTTAVATQSAELLDHRRSKRFLDDNHAPTMPRENCATILFVARGDAKNPHLLIAAAVQPSLGISSSTIPRSILVQELKRPKRSFLVV